MAEVESHPFDLDTMLFMDWRDDHTQVGRLWVICPAGGCRLNQIRVPEQIWDCWTPFSQTICAMLWSHIVHSHVCCATLMQGQIKGCDGEQHTHVITNMPSQIVWPC